jgi:hypothetical protein
MRLDKQREHRFDSLVRVGGNSVDSESPPSVLKREVGVGRRHNPRVRVLKLLESPRAADVSKSRIRQPRRPDTSDSGAFALALSSYIPGYSLTKFAYSLTP